MVKNSLKKEVKIKKFVGHLGEIENEVVNASTLIYLVQTRNIKL